MAAIEKFAQFTYRGNFSSNQRANENAYPRSTTFLQARVNELMLAESAMCLFAHSEQLLSL